MHISFEIHSQQKQTEQQETYQVEKQFAILLAAVFKNAGSYASPYLLTILSM